MDRARAEAPSVSREQEKSARGRLGYVDGLRALAALEVVAGHCGLTIWSTMPSQGIINAFVWVFSFGHQAVSVFIVLSGFSLMLPVARNDSRLPRNVWRFYWRRARRILPPYYLAMALSLLLIWLLIGQKTGTLWDNALPVTGQAIIEHVLLFQDFSALNHATINYVFWSIAMECQIYLFFPFFLLLWRRLSPVTTVLVIVIFSVVLLFALIPTWIGHLPEYGEVAFAPQYFGLFALGMFAAHFSVHPTPSWSWVRDRFGWDVLALCCFLLVTLESAHWPPVIFDLPVGIGTVGLLLAASRPSHAIHVNPLRAALEWRPLVWIGGFSYSLYLIHAPLIQLLWQYVFHPMRWSDTATYLALLLLGVPLIVAASWVFWYCCERPFLNTTGAARQRKQRSQVELAHTPSAR